MLHLVPFVAGAAIGVGAVMLLGNKKTQEKLSQGREYVTGKLGEGKEYVSGKIDNGVSTVKAIGDCVSEKRGKNTETTEGTEIATEGENNQ